MSSPYSLQFSERAVADLGRLDRAVAVRIVTKLEWLAANALLVQHMSLKGQWSGFFKLRIGKYRAIYSLDHETELIEVERINHRGDVYE